ncbi:hypothetical protein ACFXAZ_28390, partial [Streptomyces sp. NPDC059477]|uniref:hypothetical protein n=1 Tax=Streptomyces sp. NPDC059477 TaxID=3346847 RepID=UPI0036C3E681
PPPPPAPPATGVRSPNPPPARRFFQHAGGHGDFGTVAGVATPGFPAYARLLHPAALGERPVRWAAVAAAYGREVSAATRWHELIGKDRDYLNDADPGLPGVWDEHPAEGPTPIELAATLVPVLTRHTTTPDRCWFGLWHGYGRLEFDGVPTFATPHRERVLLSGALTDVTAPEPADEFAELPDLWWPEDTAWCLGGDVDLVSTYVGGTPELIADLLATPGVEAHPVAPGALVD